MKKTLYVEWGSNSYALKLQADAICRFEKETHCTILKFANRITDNKVCMDELALFIRCFLEVPEPIETLIFEAGLNNAVAVAAYILNILLLGIGNIEKTNTIYIDELEMLKARFPDDYCAV